MIVCYNLWGEPVRTLRFWTRAGAEKRRLDWAAMPTGYVSLAERAA